MWLPSARKTLQILSMNLGTAWLILCARNAANSVGAKWEKATNKGKAEKNKRNHLAGEERFNLWKGDFQLHPPPWSFRGFYSAITVFVWFGVWCFVFFSSGQRVLKRREILESLNKLHWGRGGGEKRKTNRTQKDLTVLTSGKISGWEFVPRWGAQLCPIDPPTSIILFKQERKHW